MPKFPKIPTSPVTSSNVAEIGHDPTTNTLAVKFHNGGLFYYGGVPAGKFAEMQQAESVGRYLHSEIKGKHSHLRVNPEDFTDTEKTS